MEVSYKFISEYMTSVKDFICKTIETPEVSDGISTIASGTTNLLSGAGLIIVGLYQITRGAATAAVLSSQAPIMIEDRYRFKTVRKNPITDEWTEIEEK